MLEIGADERRCEREKRAFFRIEAIEDTMSNDDTPKIITPPNTLKNKVTVGGPGAVDLEALERAEAVIAQLSDNYLEWVQEDLDNIQKAFDDLRKTMNDPKPVLERIFQISHDIKGQGGSFGYQLMTAVGNELCRFVEKLEAVRPWHVEAIKAHIDTMKLVIGKRMTGDGGAAGGALLDGLHMIVEKLMKNSG